MSRLDRALDAIEVTRDDLRRFVGTAQDESVATPWMRPTSDDAVIVQVTRPREAVRLRLPSSPMRDFPPGQARRLGLALIVASEYVDTPAPTAESVLAEIERTLTSPNVLHQERVALARKILDEWRAES